MANIVLRKGASVLDSCLRRTRVYKLDLNVIFLQLPIQNIHTILFLNIMFIS